MSSRYSRFPQGIEQRLPAPVSIKNDIMLTPNHENIHANSSKQPFCLLVDSRDRNMEFYSNPNSYVIDIPRYKDVLSVELVAADIPHTGFNIDRDCNVIYIAVTRDMFRQYYNGIRTTGTSYIEVPIPPGYYEASDLVSSSGGTDVYYQFYYQPTPVGYTWNTGIVAQALRLATSVAGYDMNFAVVFNIKTLKFTIISDSYFSFLVRDMDVDNNQVKPTVFDNGITSQASNSILGSNNDRFTVLKNSVYNILGFDLKNYHPYTNTYSYVANPLPGGGSGLLDGAFSVPGSVQPAVGNNYYFPTPYVVDFYNPYNPANPCDVTQTGLPAVSGTVGASTYVVYSAPFRANLTGEKYIILDIPELNYRDITSSANPSYYMRCLLDTNYNITTIQNPTTTNIASLNTTKCIKSSDIGNNRCIKYFTPSQGVLSKLTVRWYKHDGTPYDFQGQEHTLTFEIMTVKQTGTYFD
jgi:hypothetical protein